MAGAMAAASLSDELEPATARTRIRSIPSLPHGRRCHGGRYGHDLPLRRPEVRHHPHLHLASTSSWAGGSRPGESRRRALSPSSSSTTAPASPTCRSSATPLSIRLGHFELLRQSSSLISSSGDTPFPIPLAPSLAPATRQFTITVSSAGGTPFP
uniref:Uncharacterized protein n=1 Tax=Oryza rufipogon TaxID=4529 RepID=A0A0E0QDN4_ORYRU